eukprot:1304833-Lingulodinium_polyedra.AAC.1
MSGSIAADNFYDTLRRTTEARELEVLIEGARRKARVAMALRDGDADSRNIKLCVREARRDNLRS